MFRRLGTFSIAVGTATAVGSALVVGLDFVSQISFLKGFPSLASELFLIGWLLVAVIGIGILVMPVDFYFIVWGTSLAKNPSPILSLELLGYFGLVGAIIGYRSATRTNKSRQENELEAVLNSYLLIALLNLAIVVVIWILSASLVGLLLQAVLEGATGKSLSVFFLTSVVENGTILAMFSLFFSKLLSDDNEIFPSADCKKGGICELDRV